MLSQKFVYENELGQIHKAKLDIKISQIAIKQKFDVKGNGALIRIWKDDKKQIKILTKTNQKEIKR